MINPHKKTSPHLEYYLALAKDIENLSRYIELSEDNYSTFSIELTRLMLAIGSEIDVVAKLLCLKYEPGSKAKLKNINCHKKILLKHLPSITGISVKIARYSLSFVPWKAWSPDSNPQWWTSYNNVKHHRSDSYQEANLGNVLNALSGLCVLVCYLDSEEIAKGLNIRIPIIFLDSKYEQGCKALTSPGWKLPEE